MFVKQLSSQHQNFSSASLTLGALQENSKHTNQVLICNSKNKQHKPQKKSGITHLRGQTHRNQEPWAKRKLVYSLPCSYIACKCLPLTPGPSIVPAQQFWENYTGFVCEFSVGINPNINNFKMEGKCRRVVLVTFG